MQFIHIFYGALQLEWHKELLVLWKNGTVNNKCFSNCKVNLEVIKLLRLLHTSLPFAPSAKPVRVLEKLF